MGTTNLAKELILKDIADRIVRELTEYKVLSPSLFAGSFGEIVYLYYASRAGVITDDVPDRYLDKLFETYRYLPTIGTYCNGLAGLCLGLELLEDNGFVSGAANATKSCEKQLAQELSAYLNDNDLDFLHGATGIALYFLRHISDSNLAREQISKVIKRLDEVAVRDDFGGIHFLYKNLEGKMTSNISLSHGLSSTAIFLSRAYLSPIGETDKEKCLDLLTGIGVFLRRQLLKPERFGCFTPTFPIDDEHGACRSRLAWCYGDIGLALAFRAIGDALGDSSYLRIFEDISLYIAKHRTSPADNYIADAGICHGSAGVWQFMKYCYQIYGLEDYEKAAQYWKQVTMGMAHKESEGYGFGQYDPRKDIIEPCLNLLEGDAGVGLTMLNADNFLNTILLYER